MQLASFYPQLSMNDVIGHENAKKALQRLFSLCAPTTARRKRNESFGLVTGSGGALLYGPPGTVAPRTIGSLSYTTSLTLLQLMMT